ncbi:hypothetical protein HELRODRAFT_87213 [Helobdella robusta]|uniref:Tafazzin family protein n=1 Tax=Helobdella robusta TaxID=6412 RepID=T1G6N1_HELRO|nr:hypothetical protein HELRODRAFT_87213 [Helobdella robusta]ESN94972.1 hypothetical protein HELRODRAFT_87213 [Helobdella robusta]
MPLSVKWPYSPIGQFSFGWKLASRLTMGAVGLTSKFFIDFLNRTKIYNAHVLHDSIENRPKDRPLITICNHHSCLDEPLIWALLKWKHHSYRNDLMRWTTGAADVCFNKEWHSKFFALGRTIPLVRGDGVYQRSMDFAVQLLNQGAWVHIYPEGKVNLTHRHMRLKWGIGRLIADCQMTPIVIPFWHLGCMDDILPNTRPYRLKMFKKLSVLIGQPMDLKETIDQLNKSKATPVEKRKVLTDMIQSEFRKLEEEAKSLHYARSGRGLKFHTTDTIVNSSSNNNNKNNNKNNNNNNKSSRSDTKCDSVDLSVLKSDDRHV